jgi:hypothetical protein
MAEKRLHQAVYVSGGKATSSSEDIELSYERHTKLAIDLRKTLMRQGKVISIIGQGGFNALYLGGVIEDNLHITLDPREYSFNCLNNPKYHLRKTIFTHETPQGLAKLVAAAGFPIFH